MKILSTPPTDVITKNTILEITRDIGDDYDMYYMWACATPLSDVIVTKKKCILVIKDTLSDGYVTGYMPYAEDIIALAKDNPATNFIIVSSMENIAPTFSGSENVCTVHMGGDWINELELYSQLSPARIKNFDSKKTILCLNRNPRFHRMVNISHLYGNGLFNNAVITYLHDDLLKQKSLLDIVPWDFSTISPTKRVQILEGFEVMKNLLPPADDYDIYKDIGLVNTLVNFETRLRPYYTDSFVEIVSETTFAESAIHLTEKSLYPILGFNFPITLASVGTIAFMRKLGFDMFDDVVDNSHDLEEDPVKRVTYAIDKNFELLHNSDLAKRKWAECLPRFEKNWNLVSSGALAQWYTSRLKLEFTAALKDLTKIAS